MGRHNFQVRIRDGHPRQALPLQGPQTTLGTVFQKEKLKE